MVQTTIMIKKSPAIGNDDAPVKISTLKKKKKKDRLKPRGGRERLTKRRASSKKSTSATNGSGRSVLLFQDFPGAVNFSSARYSRANIGGPFSFSFSLSCSKGNCTDETSPLFISIYFDSMERNREERKIEGKKGEREESL